MRFENWDFAGRQKITLSPHRNPGGQIIFWTPQKCLTFYSNGVIIYTPVIPTKSVIIFLYTAPLVMKPVSIESPHRELSIDTGCISNGSISRTIDTFLLDDFLWGYKKTNVPQNDENLYSIWGDKKRNYLQECFGGTTQIFVPPRFEPHIIFFRHTKHINSCEAS